MNRMDRAFKIILDAQRMQIYQIDKLPCAESGMVLSSRAMFLAGTTSPTRTARSIVEYPKYGITRCSEEHCCPTNSQARLYVSITAASLMVPEIRTAGRFRIFQD